MCGICGVAGIAEPGPLLDRMLPRLAHRGPDNTARWTGPGMGLGHTRLSIVDLSAAGNQPMANEDQTLWLVANGEIYNSPDLRRELEAKGHAFSSRSDCEVLLHGFEHQAEAFLQRINGMAALALWDTARQRLVLARDRLGIKPLYYAHLPGGSLFFASEIKALLACMEVPAAIDAEGLAQYLTYENTFGARTLHASISMVEPGQWVAWHDGRLETGRFWEPRFSEPADARQAPDLGQAAEAWMHTAKESVARHMMSDVEVAAYLSSGFDSTAVATLAAGHAGGPLSTFTGAFGQGGWYDETPGARAVADGIGSRHTEVRMGAQDFGAVLDDLVFALDEPRMGVGSFSQYMVARRAAERVKVILTGHGGDEMFAGYPVFKFLRLKQRFRANPLAAPLLLAKVRPAEWPHVAYFTLQGFLGGKGRFLPTIFTRSRLERALTPEAHARLKDMRPEAELDQLLGQERDPYRRLTRTYLRAYLPGLFVVEDKISMAHALESRTPLCDNAMVDLALTLPLALKLHGDTLKAIPKHALRGVLPDVLYAQPKRGFPTPLATWLRGGLRDFMRSRITAQDSPLRALFRPQVLERMALGYAGSWKRRLRPLDELQTHRIWHLLCLDAWLRNAKERLGRSLGL